MNNIDEKYLQHQLDGLHGQGKYIKECDDCGSPESSFFSYVTIDGVEVFTPPANGLHWQGKYICVDCVNSYIGFDCALWLQGE